jgi:hypothetical protein
MARLRRKPGLQKIVDKRTEIIAQDQQDGEQNNGKQDDHEGVFDKALPRAIGG